MAEVHTRPHLLEREDELAAVDALIDRAAGGEGDLVAVEGAPGIGKTTLILEALQAARRARFIRLHARGGELERGFAHGVARELLQPVADTRPELRTAPLEAALTGGPAGGSGGGPERAYAISHAAYGLVAALAQERPVLVCIDDLQWCDPESAAVILHIARRLRGLPVAILVATRPPDTQMDAVVATLLGLASQTLRIGPLTLSAVRELVTDRMHSADPAFIAACQAATRGNPYLVGRLVAALVDARIEPSAAAAATVETFGARALGRETLLRLGRLSSAARSLARATAILGTNAEIRHASALADLDGDTAALAADELAAAGIFAPGRPLEFQHPLVRSAVHEEIPAGAVALGHGRAARLLAAEGARADVVASHLLHTDAAGDESAVAGLVAGARQARMTGATVRAHAFLERALAEPPRIDVRPRVLADLGAIEYDLGLPAAADHLRAALATEPDRAIRAKLWLQLLYALGARTRPAEMHAVIESGLADLPPGADEIFSLRLTQLLTPPPEGIAGYHGVGPGFDDLLEAARLGSGPYARTVVFWELGRRLMGGQVDADQAWSEAEPLLEEGIDPLMSFAAEGQLRVRLHRFDGFWEWSDALERRLRADGAVGRLAHLLSWRAEAFVRLGRLREAETTARTLTALATEAPVEEANLLRVFHLGVVLALRGNAGAALDVLQRAPDPEPGADRGYWEMHMGIVRGMAAMARGDARAAVDPLLLADRMLRAQGEINPALSEYPIPVVEALALAGRHDEAAELAQARVEVSARCGPPGTHGQTLVEDGIRRIACGDGEAEAVLHGALGILRPTPCDLARARAHHQLGAHLRRQKRIREAREHLQIALDLASAGGIDGLAAVAGAELLASGARPRRTRLAGLDSLTASERRVAELAAQGLSNVEIAQMLFITLSTVEKHLTNAYRKLGCKREGLAIALAAVT